MNNGIRVLYPRTSYGKLNQKFQQILLPKIEEFMEIAKEPVQENFPYMLDISHDEYHYQNYISTVFYISMEIGGAHPDHQIVTVVYDKKEDNFITIETLYQKDPNVLNYVSEESRRILLKNPKIENREMLFSGTEPNLDNFKYFTFTETGILFFFPQYQIAPYAAGMFKINIPYKKH